MLSKQGWKEGDYLGASNASHAEHYTAANASHIRVLLREDNLGIGAKVGGKANADTFGLSTLSGIFGRLNGRDEGEVQKQQDNLRDAELRTYQAQKFGFMNFVRGGFLVGDEIIEDVEGAVKAENASEESKVVVKKEKGSKKRKVEDEDTAVKVEEPRLKRKKKSSDLKAESIAESDASETKLPSKSSKKDRKRITVKEEPVEETAGSAMKSTGQDVKIKIEDDEDSEASAAAPTKLSKEEKARLKAEKRARKEARRIRREAKQRAKELKSELATPATSTPTSGTSTPSSATFAFAGSRHAVRQRYIQQKRLASMDPQALKEILMIKAEA